MINIDFISRREWLKQAGLLSAGLFLSENILAAVAKKNPTILLVSGWQDVNIGDIAHTPGMLHVLETFLPEAKIILWKKSNGGPEVKKLLSTNFPKVKVIYGTVNANKETDSPEVNQAVATADLMIHGSGPLLVGADNLALWLKATKKPFGIFGTTLQNPEPYHQEILKKAAFIFTRETLSIEHLKKAGITGKHIEFAPDATFYANIRNNPLAETFLRENKLEAKKFICVVPRLRYTPYHKINANNNNWTPEKIKEVETVNARFKEQDHAKLREAMIAWVTETGNKVLICPEMTYQVDIMDKLLFNPLPEKIKPFVLKRGYWLPDEAASVYAKAHTVLSLECHSPILAAVNGTPAFYLRQPEDTIKGQMYYDLGFNDWIFEIDKTTGKQIADRLKEVWTDYSGAQNKLKANMTRVDKIYRERTASIKQQLKGKA